MRTAVISRSYVEFCVERDAIKPDGFSHRRSVKMGRMLPDSRSDQGEIYCVLTKCTKNVKCDTQTTVAGGIELNVGHLNHHKQCPTVGEVKQVFQSFQGMYRQGSGFKTFQD